MSSLFIWNPSLTGKYYCSLPPSATYKCKLHRSPWNARLRSHTSVENLLGLFFCYNAGCFAYIQVPVRRGQPIGTFTTPALKHDESANALCHPSFTAKLFFHYPPMSRLGGGIMPQSPEHAFGSVRAGSVSSGTARSPSSFLALFAADVPSSRSVG